MLKSRGFTEYRNKKNRMDFWGYPSDSCLFRSENPKTPLQIREANNERRLIFFIIHYLFPESVTCYKCRKKIQESNNKNLFFLMLQCKYRDKF